jgi:hypothetical protein
MTKAGRFVLLWFCGNLGLLAMVSIVSPALAQSVCPSQVSVCDSKTQALNTLFLSCSSGAVWCIENLWEPWRTRNPNCQEEGQVVCVQNCVNAGIQEAWCFNKCR